MIRQFRSLTAAIAVLVPMFGFGGLARADAKPAGPVVDVVFCLDTTGSMSGLIEGAKAKIWSIVNQIAGGTPVPEIRVGLLGYRDRGDAYVTKMFELTGDLDEVHKNLKGFAAGGGGDTPESVNQAIHESVTKFKWSGKKGDLSIIFLVGDAPPHMDYADDVKYAESCKVAAAKGIIVNTIQCGNHAATKNVWVEIAKLGNGSYAQIAQSGGVQVVETPFDKELAELNVKLLKTNCCWGVDKDRMAGETKNAAAAALPSGGGVAAESAGYRAKAGRIAANDLIDDIRDGKVKLEQLKPEQLPEELRKLKPEELKVHLDKLKAERDDLAKKALELDKKRLEFIAKKNAENKNKDAFDVQVLEMLRKQAEKSGIKY